ncbi:MAG TPA: YlbF family regulator [Tepidisphaeraceae bacterium]|nr:YlbF family regulator [Tepidisphaeraceae bacterium]
MASDTQEILGAAEKLGQLVVQHPAVAKYRDAQRAVTTDPEASRLMGDFGRQIETLAKQEQAGQGISDAQRQQLEAAQARIASNLKVKALNLAEFEFTDLLRKISQTWQKPLAEASGARAAAPAPARTIQ